MEGCVAILGGRGDFWAHLVISAGIRHVLLEAQLKACLFRSRSIPRTGSGATPPSSSSAGISSDGIEVALCSATEPAVGISLEPTEDYWL